MMTKMIHTVNNKNDHQQPEMTAVPEPVQIQTGVTWPGVIPEFWASDSLAWGTWVLVSAQQYTSVSIFHLGKGDLNI